MNTIHYLIFRMTFTTSLGVTAIFFNQLMAEIARGNFTGLLMPPLLILVSGFMMLAWPRDQQILFVSITGIVCYAMILLTCFLLISFGQDKQQAGAFAGLAMIIGIAGSVIAAIGMILWTVQFILQRQQSNSPTPPEFKP